MNKPTLEALKKSIEHWRRLSTGTEKPGEETGIAHCALCAMFFDSFDSPSGTGCGGCPVSERTGHERCNGSPYEAVMDARDEFGQGSPEFKVEAKKELAFLISLLPSPKRKA